MKKILLFIAILTLLGFLGLFFVIYTIRNLNPEELKSFVLDKANQEINGELQIESVQLDGFSKISLKNARLLGKNGTTLAEIPEVNLGISIFELLTTFKISFSELEINNPRLYPSLVNEKWNFATLIREKGPEPSQVPPSQNAAPATTATTPAPTVPKLSAVTEVPGSLTIRNIKINNAVTSISALPYPLLTITINLKGSVNWPEIEIQKLQIQTTDMLSISADAKFNLQSNKLRLNLQNSEIISAGIAEFLKISLPGPEKVDISGSIDLENMELNPNLKFLVSSMELPESGFSLPAFEIIADKTGLRTNPVLKTLYGPLQSSFSMQFPMKIAQILKQSWPFTAGITGVNFLINQKKLPGASLNISGVFQPENSVLEISSGQLITEPAKGKINFSLLSRLQTNPPETEGRIVATGVELSPFVNPFSPIPVSFSLQNMNASLKKQEIYIESLESNLNSGKISFSGSILPFAENPMTIVRGNGKIETLPLNTFAKELEGLVLENFNFDEKMNANARVRGFGKTNLIATATPGASLEKPLAAATLTGTIDNQQVAICLPEYKNLLPKGIIELDFQVNPEYLLKGSLKSKQLLQPVTEGIADIEIDNIELQLETEMMAMKGRLTKVYSELFSGTLTAIGGFHAAPPELKMQGELAGIDANQLFSHFTPLMKDHTRGQIQLSFSPLLINEPLDRTYPAKTSGKVNIRNIHYFYHKTIIEIINVVEESIKGKIPTGFLQRTADKMKKENRPGASFANLENLDYHFDSGLLQLGEVQLQEIQNKFQVQLSQFVIRLPKSEIEPGHIRGTMTIRLANAFLQEKFPVKDSFKDDLSLSLNLNGNFDQPIPPHEINRVRSEALNTLINIIDLKKVEKSAKEQLKKLEDVAKDALGDVISGLNNSLNKDKTPAAAQPDQQNTGKTDKNEVEALKDKLKEEAKKLENSFKSLFRR